jgi:phage gp36-like protein
VSYYTSNANLSAYISAQNLIFLTDDFATGSLNQQVLDAVITGVSGTIDGLLAGTYQTPFQNPPPTVTEACTMLCCKALMDRRLVPGEGNRFKGEADIWWKTLEDISQGRRSLDANTPAAFSPGYVSAFCTPISSTA